MSFLGRMFGGKKGDKAPTTGEAIQKLRETEEMLMKKEEFLEKKIAQEIEIAKKNGTKNKRGAQLLSVVPLNCPYDLHPHDSLLYLWGSDTKQ
jgi:hypothetical protein